MKNKSIQIQEKHHRELQILSERLGQSYGKLVEEMIIYFKKTGINPTESKNENPSRGLKELDKRLVSFLKVQERDILNPLRQEAYDYHQILNKELKAARSKINNNIIQLDTNEKDRKDEILDELNSQRKVLISICEHLDPKNKKGLITTFQNIFKNAD